MNSIPQNARSQHVLRLHPGSLTPDHIVDQVAGHIQSQYEARVIALAVQELGIVAPALGESAVMEIVTNVWEQAKRHEADGARTSWPHLSWFVQQAVANRREGLRTLPLRHSITRPGTTYRMAG